MDCHFLLQGISLTQGSNLGLLHCRQILYYLNGGLSTLVEFEFPALKAKSYCLTCVGHTEACPHSLISAKVILTSSFVKPRCEIITE